MRAEMSPLPGAGLAAAGGGRGAWLGALAVVAAAALVFLPALGARDFWAPDEPRFAVIAREMLRSGDWIVPRMNGYPIALLPPLTYWLAALPSVPAGDVTETTGRLALVGSGALALLGVYALGRRIGGTTGAGLASAAVLGTTAQFVHQTRFLQADIHLFAGTTWALALFYQGYLEPERRRVCYPLMGVAIAFGWLAKGPVAAVVPGLVVLVFLLARRDLWRGLLANAGFWAAVAACIALVAPWYVAVCWRVNEPDFTKELLLKHNFGMFFETWSHLEPFYYYLVQLPAFLLPWTPLLPGAVAWLWRRAGTEEARRDRLFLVVWAASLLIFYSISEAKQAKYLLPLYPAPAIAVGLLWAEAGRALETLRRPRWLVHGPLLLISGVFALAGVAGVLVGVVGVYPAAASHPWLARAAVFGGIGFLVVGSIGAIAVRGGRTAGSFACVAAAVAVGAVVAQVVVLPGINERKSARRLCAKMGLHAPPDEPIGIYGLGSRQHGDYIYYSGRRIVIFRDEDRLAPEPERPEDRVERLEAYLRSDRPVYVLAPTKLFDAAIRTHPTTGPLVHELFREDKGSKSFVFFTNAKAQARVVRQ